MDSDSLLVRQNACAFPARERMAMSDGMGARESAMIVFEAGDAHRKWTLEWHSGAPLPERIPGRLYSVTADGEEAALVLSLLRDYKRKNSPVSEEWK